MKEVSLYSVISGDYTITQEQLDSFKALLIRGMRSEQHKRRIHSLTLGRLTCLRNHGIYGRVVFDESGCIYWPSQSYPDELRTVRELLLKG